jgi:MSHA pilin protein MshD
MKRRMQGVTLVELIVSIVIISVAVISVMGAFSAVATNSAGALVQEQGASIASSYLNEILQKSFADPEGNVAPEASRDLYDNVLDYNNLVDNGAHDQSGNAIASLDQFQISVSVVPGNLNALPAANVWRVDVTVTHPSMPTILLTGYRTKY